MLPLFSLSDIPMLEAKVIWQITLSSIVSTHGHIWDMGQGLLLLIVCM
jgi:hypothetical protein